MPKKAKGWTVKVQPSGSNWRCRWYGKYGTGQQVFAHKQDAKELRDDKRRDFERMDSGLPALLKPVSAVTVDQWADTYLRDSKKEKAPRTYNNFDLPAVTSFRKAHGNLALGAVVEQHVKDWKYSMEEKYNGTTALMYFRQLRAFFNAAIRAEIITKNPAKHVRKPLGVGGGRALRDSELEPLMRCAPEALFKTGIFSLNTFTRINEVCIFDWAWVWDLEDGSWMGKIPSQFRKTRSKVKHDCIFPINAAARAVMGPRQLAGRVFRWKENTIQQQIVMTRRAAQLPEDVTFHCFRHTGASRYLREGGHMEDLLDSHIWEDPRSLLVYVHVEPTTLFKRFSGLKYPVLGPNRGLNAKDPGEAPPGS